jgi:glycosyltransferase involved in cell wall biosynthesis
VVDSEYTSRVNWYLKKLKHHLDYKFSGDPAIQVRDFLSTFKEAEDLNRIIEGMAVLILPYFLEGRAKSGLSFRLKEAAASLPKLPVALQWLLQSIATDVVFAAVCQKSLFSEADARRR